MVLSQPTAQTPAQALAQTPAADEVAADRLIFGRILALATADPVRTMSQALALRKADLAELAARHAPQFADWVAALPDGDEAGEDAIEEADLRAFLTEHGARGPTRSAGSLPS